MNRPGSGRVRGEKRPGKRSLAPEQECVRVGGWDGGVEWDSSECGSRLPRRVAGDPPASLHPLLPRHTGDSNSLAEESDSTADS